jgi:hypothetical protein
MNYAHQLSPNFDKVTNVHAQGFIIDPINITPEKEKKKKGFELQG